MQVFPGLWVYPDIELSVLEVYGHYPIAYLEGSPFAFWCHIFNFSDFRNLLSELRSMIGLHLLLLLETKIVC